MSSNTLLQEEESRDREFQVTALYSDMYLTGALTTTVHESTG
mgnify:CR=1 FL=1